jgi:hypothetical protein
VFQSRLLYLGFSQSFAEKPGRRKQILSIAGGPSRKSGAQDDRTFKQFPFGIDQIPTNETASAFLGVLCG